ncbi:methyltransferase domain-containing protein [bacterium]|nr:methyltransferase domain-containing protein [candidate division CSSED10-310 bacterium]
MPACFRNQLRVKSRLDPSHSGTGETAAALNRAAGPHTRVFALDCSRPMLSRLKHKPGAETVFPAQADASAVPFPDDCFDLITISFATRNLYTSEEHLIACLNEFHRVLKVGISHTIIWPGP